MNKGLALVPLVRSLFLVLFSGRWVLGWQRQWAREHPPRRGNQTRPATAQRKNKQAKLNQSRVRAEGPTRFYARIFSLRVSLWYLIFQRLNSDHTQAAVVRDVRQGGADRLGPKGRRLSRRQQSTQASGYNQARRRLPLEFLQAALGQVQQRMVKLAGWVVGSGSASGPQERVRQLLDGSTLAMLWTPALGQAYPPARNGRGRSDWCLMRILVGFCVRSGAVLSGIEGTVHQSEQALAWVLFQKAHAFTIWIGDRNFGVWSVVAAAVHHQQDVLVRLTKSRAAMLCRGRPMRSGQERWIQWAPSRHDQVPPGLERQTVGGRLIYVRLKKAGRWIDLWLFTTLEAQDVPVALLVKWYGQRWQAELHFRSVKTQMEMAQLQVTTPALARKEFYAGLLAYSLVRGVMWAAGNRLEADGKAISFSQAKRVLLDGLEDWGRGVGWGVGPAADWTRSLLAEVARQRLPKRRQQRPSEVRQVRSRASKFPKLNGSRAAARARSGCTKS